MEWLCVVVIVVQWLCVGIVVVGQGYGGRCQVLVGLLVLQGVVVVIVVIGLVGQGDGVVWVEQGGVGQVQYVVWLVVCDVELEVIVDVFFGQQLVDEGVVVFVELYVV